MVCPQGAESEGRHLVCPQEQNLKEETWPVLREPSLRGETWPVHRKPSLRAQHEGLALRAFNRNTEPFSGAVQSEESGETNTKQGSPGRSTLPFTLQTAMETGPQCPRLWARTSSVSPEPQREGQVGRPERGQAVTQPLQLPREHFTTSPIPRRLLDGASKAIPGLYFIVTFICKGCQSGPEVGWPAALRSSLHAHTHTHTHTHLLSTHKGHPKTHMSWAHRLRLHESGPPRCTTPGAPFTSPLLSYTVSYTHTAKHTGLWPWCTQAREHRSTHTHRSTPSDHQRPRELRPRAPQPGPS